MAYDRSHPYSGRHLIMNLTAAAGPWSEALPSPGGASDRRHPGDLAAAGAASSGYGGRMARGRLTAWFTTSPVAVYRWWGRCTRAFFFIWMRKRSSSMMRRMVVSTSRPGGQGDGAAPAGSSAWDACVCSVVGIAGVVPTAQPFPGASPGQVGQLRVQAPADQVADRRGCRCTLRQPAFKGADVAQDGGRFLVPAQAAEGFGHPLGSDAGEEVGQIEVNHHTAADVRTGIVHDRAAAHEAGGRRMHFERVEQPV